MLCTEWRQGDRGAHVNAMRAAIIATSLVPDKLYSGSVNALLHRCLSVVRSYHVMANYGSAKKANRNPLRCAGAMPS